MFDDGHVRTTVDDIACLMPETVRKLDITMVPISHNISEDAITTSAVSPLKLCAAYACALECLNKGGSDVGVVALHFGKGMSVTWSNAVAAAKALDRVTVINADTVGAGVSAAAIAAVRIARTGASRDEVADVARDVLQHYRLWLFVPELNSLRRGGHISANQVMLSTALVVKPIVGIKDGSLALVVKYRTEAKVKQRIMDFVVKTVRSVSSTDCPSAVLLHHSGALDDVHELQAILAEKLPGNTRFRVLGSPESLTAHAGQEAYAINMILGGSIDSDTMGFEAEMDVTALPHSVEKSDARVVDVKTVDTVDDDSGSIDNSSDSVGMDGSIENAGATDSGEPITDQAEMRVIESPVANRNHNKRTHRTVMTNEQGIPLFTTAASRLPTWSKNRQAALNKAECLAKTISDLVLCDKFDPEGIVFGAEGEKSQESSLSDKHGDGGDEKKKQFLDRDDDVACG